MAFVNISFCDISRKKNSAQFLAADVHYSVVNNLFTTVANFLSPGIVAANFELIESMISANYSFKAHYFPDQEHNGILPGLVAFSFKHTQSSRHLSNPR